MRRQDWPRVLDEYILANKRFEWLENNCLFFALGAADAITNRNLKEKYKGPKTIVGLKRKLHRLGWRDVPHFMDDHFPRENNVNKLQRGDLCALRWPDHELFPVAIGVCIGSRAVFVSDNGLMIIPLVQCFAGWRVD